MPFALLLFLLFAVTGCAPNPHASFCGAPYPIGIYAVGSTSNLPSLRQAGFSLVTGPASRAFLDAANDSRLRVLAATGSAAGPNMDPEIVRRTVRDLDGHPALWAWYLSDEPDLNGIAPEDVLRLHRTVRGAGARRPTALVVYRGPSLARWNGADILMVDRYPVGWQPLATFFQHMQHGAVAAGSSRRPFLAVIQAFDWSRYSDRHPFPEPVERRAPTREELRCMAWGARIIGADGLFFYCHEDGRWRMTDHPETRDALNSVVGELRRREPLLTAARSSSPPRSAYLEPTRRFNEVLEPSVLWTSWRVQTGTRDVPAGEYWIMVNTTAEHHQIRIDEPAWHGRQVPDLDAGSRAIDSEGWMDALGPYEVRLIGPLPILP